MNKSSGPCHPLQQPLLPQYEFSIENVFVMWKERVWSTDVCMYV